MEIEMIGMLVFCDGEYWVCNAEEEWVWPFQVGEQAEVQVGGCWHRATMQSGGYRGRYLRFADGRWARPAVCMPVRLAVL